jgi:RNA polymerase sigma factor (sigma-70 family)
MVVFERDVGLPSPSEVEFRRQYGQLVGLAAQLVDAPEAAEDVVQTVFTRMQSRPPKTAPSDMSAYLRKAVVNEARSALRRRRASRRWLFEPAAVTGPSADEAVLASEETERVLTAISKLPRRQREVIALRYYADLSVAAIASTLEIKPSAVTSSLARARKTLRTTLGEQDARSQ